MKITVRQLRRVIKEEVSRLLQESPGGLTSDLADHIAVRMDSVAGRNPSPDADALYSAALNVLKKFPRARELRGHDDSTVLEALDDPSLKAAALEKFDELRAAIIPDPGGYVPEGPGFDPDLKGPRKGGPSGSSKVPYGTRFIPIARRPDGSPRRG